MITAHLWSQLISDGLTDRARLVALYLLDMDPRVHWSGIVVPGCGRRGPLLDLLNDVGMERWLEHDHLYVRVCDSLLWTSQHVHGINTLRAWGKRHVDHKMPRVMGGTRDPHNLVTSCESCNRGKASSPVDGNA